MLQSQSGVKFSKHSLLGHLWSAVMKEFIPRKKSLALSSQLVLFLAHWNRKQNRNAGTRCHSLVVKRVFAAFLFHFDGEILWTKKTHFWKPQEVICVNHKRQIQVPLSYYESCMYILPTLFLSFLCEPFLYNFRNCFFINCLFNLRNNKKIYI